MSTTRDSISQLFDGSVEHKSNRIKRLRRIAQRAPEVMVKISGNAKSAGHIVAHLEYISRNGKLEVEDEQGQIYQDKSTVTQLANDWGLELQGKRKNSRYTTNIVLSMPAGTEPKAVKQAARAFAHNTFGQNYQYAFALHTDTDSPHVHLMIKNLGFDGKRLHIKNGQPQKWREGFAEELEKLGIAAEATTRLTRGVVRKGIKQAIIHIRERGLGAAKTDKAKIQEVLANQHQSTTKQVPWLPSIKKQQNFIRYAWLNQAKQLMQSGEVDKQQLAREIYDFVKDMPPIKTERQEMKDKLREKSSQKER